MLLFSIEFTQSAEKQFEKLEPQIQARIVAVVERLRFRPVEHLVKLVDEDAYKCRAGDYRIICTVDYEKQVIYVLKVGHRRNVYVSENALDAHY